MRILIAIFIGLAVVISTESCLDTPVSDRLSYEDQKYADSIFFLIKVDYERELDSICTVESDKVFQRLADSIYDVRVAEIKQITGK